MIDYSKCSVINCDHQTHARGWCDAHYMRWWRNGDPLFVGHRRRKRNGKPRQFLMAALSYGRENCLIWPYGKSYGYAVMRFAGRSRHVSRIICRIKYGPAPAINYEAAHSCGKGHLGCVAPKHLRWASPAENEADKIKHGTSNGGVRNGNARLTEAQVMAIRNLLRAGMRQQKIANEFGVVQSVISRIGNGVRWNSLMEAR